MNYIHLQNNIVIPIHSDDEGLFRKLRKKWNKIIELIGINNAQDFLETTLDNGDEFIMVDIHKSISFVKGNYRNKLAIVLHSVINDYLQTSLVQHMC